MTTIKYQKNKDLLYYNLLTHWHIYFSWQSTYFSKSLFSHQNVLKVNFLLMFWGSRYFGCCIFLIYQIIVLNCLLLSMIRDRVNGSWPISSCELCGLCLFFYDGRVWEIFRRMKFYSFKNTVSRYCESDTYFFHVNKSVIVF